MPQAVASIEVYVRLGMFLGVLALVAMFESLAPRRSRSVPRGTRWPSNLALVALNSVLLRFGLPVSAVGVAVTAEAGGWGLFNVFSLPGWFVTIVAVLLLDLAIYAQHVAFHAVPVLWRLHRMHHADTDFDVTTGLRFHPIEILLSGVIKLAVVAALGAPPLAVVIFEVLLNATAMFNHGNLRLPPGLDRVLRLFVVTPDMHRVHHSVVRVETDSNFGFNVPWLDRWFGTYRAQPESGHQGMTIGLDEFRDARELRLDRMLVQPFKSATRQFGLDRA